MNAINIICNPQETIDVSQMVEVVKWYVKEHTNQNIDVNIPHPDNYRYLGPFSFIIAQNDIQTLSIMFTAACNWFADNRNKYVS